MPSSFVLIELSAQNIGEPTTNVWCATCMLPSAEVRDLAVLVHGPGQERFEPTIQLISLHGCMECGTIFEMPDVPSLVERPVEPAYRAI